MTSVGSNGLTITVLLGDDDQEEDEANQPDVTRAMREGQGGNYLLNSGCWTVTIDLQNYGGNVMKEVHDLLVGHLGDQEGSKYDEDEQLDEMICAEDIDSDGEIIPKPMESYCKEKDHQSSE